VHGTGLWGAVVAAGVLLLATLGGLWWRRRDGRLREVAGMAVTGLARYLAGPVTLVQFSSAQCAPCRAAQRICAAVAAETDGVRHVELAAEEHLDLVRELGIWRTPTVLVVDASGTVRHRVSGVPGRAALLGAVELVGSRRTVEV